jgi:hypothetical protein
MGDPMKTLSAAFESLSRQRVKDPFQALRTSPMESFEKLGFPTSRDEEWRFSASPSTAQTAPGWSSWTAI